jgi:hypothetical protein
VADSDSDKRKQQLERVLAQRRAAQEQLERANAGRRGSKKLRDQIRKGKGPG